MAEAFRYYLRVRYGECDAQGVVFNARYGDFIDLACTEYVRAAFGRNVFDGSFEIQTVRQLTEWKGSARYDDVLEARVHCTRIGNTSFTMAVDLRRAGEDEPMVTSETVYVVVDNKSWLKRPISVQERTRLEAGAAGQSVDHAAWLSPTNR